MLKKWEYLPEYLRNESVRKYYDILNDKLFSLFIKRIFDVLVAFVILILLSPLFVIISVSIKLDSKGTVIFCQYRVTQYGKLFRIYKFRTMVMNAEEIGTQVTHKNDARVTRIGSFLRKYRLDETPQLFNIILGDMSFVGTRPEVAKYVQQYTDEMMATLLLKAGVTSEASIMYKDEEKYLMFADNIDETYVYLILPEKMKYNLKSIEEFSFFNEIKIMVSTFFAMVR